MSAALDPPVAASALPPTSPVPEHISENVRMTASRELNNRTHSEGNLRKAWQFRKADQCGPRQRQV